MHAAVFVSSISKTTIQRIAPTAQSEKNRPSPSVCANGAMRKTAEERFNMLARGWLAYPVTPITFATTAEERLYMSPLGLQIIYTTALRR